MIPNVLGGSFKMKSPGILKFAFKGKEYSLQPVDEGDGTLFIIFRDAIEPERDLPGADDFSTPTSR